MGAFQAVVKKATKIKMAAPKQKYLKTILAGMDTPAVFEEIMRTLQVRVGDSAFTVVFKALVVVHVMVREGTKHVTLAYLASHRDFFELRGLLQGGAAAHSGVHLVRRYVDYLRTRAAEYGRVECDYVRDGAARLKELGRSTVVLQHVESLETQITALLRNKYSQHDLNNEMLMAAFQLLVQDILALYNGLNEGIITLLESFFELQRADAQRTLDLYKRFVQLTENVVKYLKMGKAVGLQIPVIKHITTKLIRSLEDHLRDGEAGGAPKAPAEGSNAYTETQKQLELVREQKRLLQEQLQLTSPLVQQLTAAQPAAAPAVPTGYNPFFDGNSFAQPQLQPQQTNNPFLSQAPVFQPVATGVPLPQAPLPPQHTAPLPLLAAQPTNPFAGVAPATNPFAAYNPAQMRYSYTQPELQQQQLQQLQQQQIQQQQLQQQQLQQQQIQPQQIQPQQIQPQQIQPQFQQQQQQQQQQQLQQQQQIHQQQLGYLNQNLIDI
ncbi:AaceriAEL209Wp [[Ashbya] aceris (nom. inval.)]|nr:AaceriAEL209Wp [[Ashbya] aceris (nom. inval.)]